MPGTVLSDALRSLNDGNPLRYSLMIGFASGLMLWNPGPTASVDISPYPASDRPEAGHVGRERVASAMGTDEEITIRDGILKGYGADCLELIEWARDRLSAGVRLSGPMCPTPDYDEERLRLMRWAQNFGLRGTRARDESVSVPNAMTINYALVRKGVDPDEDGEDK